MKEIERKFRETLTAEQLSIENNKPVETDAFTLKHFNALLNDAVAAQTMLHDELETLEKQPLFSQLDFRITTYEID